VDLPLPSPHISHLEPLGAKKIGVGGPARSPEGDFAPESMGGVSNKLDNSSLLRNEEPIIVPVDLVRQGGKIIGIVSDTDIFRAVEESGWGPNF